MHIHFAQLLTGALLASATAGAQPVIRSRYPVVSSASYRTPGMPGSGIAQGSIFSIFGTGLGPATPAQANTFPLPDSLANTSATVTVGATQTSVIILFAYDTQINAILPSPTPIGSGTITVTYNNQTSAAAPIQVVASAFGIFTFNSSGSGQAIATDVGYVSNSIIHTFHPGDYGILWGTGLGAIDASDAGVPPVGNLPAAINVYVGNTAASIAYQGRSGCCAGLDQIAFQIPAGVAGCHVPVGVQIGGAVGNIATIAVSTSGQTCSDSVMGQDLVDKLASGQKVDFGYVRLESQISKLLAGFTGYAQGDYADATFNEFYPATAGLAEYGVSNGYCVAVDCSNGCFTWSGSLSLSDSSAPQLDAGALSVVYGPPIPMNQYGEWYDARLTSPNGSRYLWSDTRYQVTGTGGAAVGAFSVTDTTSLGAVDFENLTSNQTMPLSGDLTIEFKRGDATLQNGQVTINGYSISGFNSDGSLDKLEMFQCTAPLSPGQFTIPAWVLSTLPPSGTGNNGTISYPLGWIWIGQYNNPLTFTAPGLDRGIITDIFYNGFGVYFR